MDPISNAFGFDSFSSAETASNANSSQKSSTGTSGATPVKVQSYEFRRDAASGVWESIKVGSLDWHEITSSHSKALVVRVSSIVNENEPGEVMERLRAEDFAADAPTPALHVVCMFKEFAVSESSPIRFTANFLFIFPSLHPHRPQDFKLAIRRVLPSRSISYITAEMLGSFLARRDYEAHAVTKVDAQERLERFILDKEPCSSFFLKMSPVVPDFCRMLLLKINDGEARELIGVRAIHKLAISCTSSSNASQHNFNETMNVMKMAAHPRHWNFVVFKTLMRLATKNDRLRRKAIQYGGEGGECDSGVSVGEGCSVPNGSQVSHMHSLIVASELDPLEKLAVRIISSEEPHDILYDEQQQLVNFMVRIITSEKDYLSNEDFKHLLNTIEDGRPAACHLTGVLLEKCIEEENFNIGWRVASTVESVNEHTIEEVVTLCSKAFFKYSRNHQTEASKWFNRVKWCFERHHKLLGKYPSGLALHVAAHRRDFDLCWRWFQAKKEDRAFRFSAHHTSSILKAASYAPHACQHMREVLQAYDMTPVSQKSAFVFEPLVHLWNATADCRDDYRLFWATVEQDLRNYLERELKNSDPVDRKMRKLTHWERVLSEWSSDGGSMPGAFGIAEMYGQQHQQQQQHSPHQHAIRSTSPVVASSYGVSAPSHSYMPQPPQQQQQQQQQQRHNRGRRGSWTPSSSSMQQQQQQRHQWSGYDDPQNQGRDILQPGIERRASSLRRHEYHQQFQQQQQHYDPYMQQRWASNGLSGIYDPLASPSHFSDDGSDYGFSTSPSMCASDERWMEQVPGIVLGSPIDSYRLGSYGVSTRLQEQSWIQQSGEGDGLVLPQSPYGDVLPSQKWSYTQAHNPHQHQQQQKHKGKKQSQKQLKQQQKQQQQKDNNTNNSKTSSLPLSSSLSTASMGEGHSSIARPFPETMSGGECSASPDEQSNQKWPRSLNSQAQWTHAVGLPM